MTPRHTIFLCFPADNLQLVASFNTAKPTSTPKNPRCGSCLQNSGCCHHEQCKAKSLRHHIKLVFETPNLMSNFELTKRVYIDDRFNSFDRIKLTYSKWSGVKNWGIDRTLNT